MKPDLWEQWQEGLFARVDGLVLGSVALDASTRRRAALVVVDDIAAMVAALDEKQVQALSKSAERVEPLPEARHVTGGRSGRAWAAMVNAVAANWNELDEGYRPATCHGGLYALPAAMAEVEARHGSLGELLTGLVAGYEVSTAYARALRPPRPLAFHPHATMAPLGAAAAVAAIRGSAGPGVKAASYVAVTLAAAGPFDHAMKGILVRNGWAGHGALTGFTAVELASAGIDGYSGSALGVLESGFRYELDEEELRSERTEWAIHDGYHKSYACCQYSHSAVEATLALVQGELAGVQVDDISSVTIDANPLAMALDDPHPQTVLGGKFSAVHSVAAVLVRGTADSDAFSDSYLDDPRVASLRSKISMQPYEGDLHAPYDRPARVAVTLNSGAVHSAECRSALGGPDRPLSDSDILDKVDLLTAGRRPRFAALARDIVEGTVGDDTPWSDVIGELWSP